MARILIFDSGSGGLSIAAAILKQLPGVSLIYCADKAFFPYGLQNEEALIERMQTLFDRLNKEYQPDIAVVACNTASTISLPSLRQKFSFPIVGVVPAIKTAANLSTTRHIGLLATPGTIQRNYTKDLIEEFARDCKTTLLGSCELVEIAEDKLRSQEIDLSALIKILKPLQAPDIDTLVLGCTHFPLVKEELITHLPHIKHWVDSGSAIANRVEYLINKGKLPTKSDQMHKYLYTDKNSPPCDAMLNSLASFGISQVESFD